MNSTQQIDEISATIKNVISTNACFTALKNDISKMGFIAQNKNITKDYLGLNKYILEKYNEDIFSIDTKSMEMRFKYTYSSGLRILKPSYWSDRKLIKQLSKDKKNKISIQEIILLLENIAQRNELFSKIKEQKSIMLSIFPI